MIPPPFSIRITVQGLAGCEEENGKKDYMNCTAFHSVANVARDILPKKNLFAPVVVFW
jgi:hypothetical protein